MILIAGPCVIESFDHCAMLADFIAERAFPLGFDFFFKASFDKANRTSSLGYRGPGLERGLNILNAVQRKVGVKVTTDIHLPSQAAPAAEMVDLIQIPALLSRQTDLIEAAARTGKPINLKKGQFMAPEDMKHAALKAQLAGAGQLYLTERGTTFGYHNLIVDMRSIAIMKALGKGPVIIDASHAVQRPGAAGAASSGDPEFIETIALAAVVAGADGFFIEVHDHPTMALSDGQNSLRTGNLVQLLKRVKAIHEALVQVTLT